MDEKITAINCITGSHPTAAMIPIHFETDRECLDAALATIGLVEPPDARVVWIRNTLELSHFACSTAYLPAIRANPSLELLADPIPLPLDAAGNLRPMAIGNHV
jgi:hypothetical protein